MSVQNFGSNELTTNTEIPSYSFVTADTLGLFVNDLSGRNDFASGVVTYNGILTSGDEYFTVKKEDNNVFNIKFKNPYDQSPFYLGFNFLVIGQNMPNENVKHGFVTDCTSSTLSQLLSGASVDPQSACSDPANVRDDHAGVKIKFIEPFKDIPSVVATPYYNVEVIAAEINPRCVVETITTEFVRIKCGAIINDTVYQPIPFMFLAVGNA